MGLRPLRDERMICMDKINYRVVCGWGIGSLGRGYFVDKSFKSIDEANKFYKGYNVGSIEDEFDGAIEKLKLIKDSWIKVSWMNDESTDEDDNFGGRVFATRKLKFK